ncbi:MAG: hypothetical protein KGL95_08175 [Patescibacteria group bacterium]|nr:hypothetical protein [Patescibacteria group bacterium]
MSITGVDTVQHRKKKTRMKRLKRITWKKVEILIVLLYRRGPKNRTVIGSVCNMNYECCDMYLNWCIRANYIKIIRNDRRRRLYELTDRGKDYFHREFEGGSMDRTYAETASIL